MATDDTTDTTTNAATSARDVERIRRRHRLAESLDSEDFGEVYVLSQESADRALTPARRAIVETLARRDVGSQRDLAAALDRDPGNVKRDIAVLVDEGLVVRHEEGRSYRPELKYDTILVEPIPTVPPAQE